MKDISEKIIQCSLHSHGQFLQAQLHIIIASVLKKELNLMELLIQNFLGFFMVICKINIYQNHATKISTLLLFPSHIYAYIRVWL